MELNDRIQGAIVGLAYGDALGLGAEFMTRQEVESYYPDGLRHFDQIIRDAHRSEWKRGEWTNDTILTNLMLECVIESGGFVPTNLCRKFQDWYAEENRDIAPVMRMFCTNREWAHNPIPVAHRLWHESGITEASNETLHRAVVTGLTSEDSAVYEQTRQFVLMTHDDSRCVSTTVVLALVLRAILKDKPIDIDYLLRICNSIDGRSVPFLEKAREGDIEGLQIDDRETQMWTRKGMAAALWGLWHTDNAADAIHKVIDLGGDADTNAGMAGALAGLKYGYDALPQEKEKIIGFDYLIDLSERLTEFVDKKVFG